MWLRKKIHQGKFWVFGLGSQTDNLCGVKVGFRECKEGLSSWRGIHGISRVIYYVGSVIGRPVNAQGLGSGILLTCGHLNSLSGEGTPARPGWNPPEDWQGICSRPTKKESFFAVARPLLQSSSSEVILSSPSHLIFICYSPQYIYRAERAPPPPSSGDPTPQFAIGDDSPKLLVHQAQLYVSSLPIVAHYAVAFDLGEDKSFLQYLVAREC
ncbi:hypothetical protein CISG_01426 [Coccidioides immitis RMSCC 3703]|uniref:Uncharacterized protein n=2 Tax=Coccidioides immitis TaxID=5501 RepID=A0A0J8QXP7_COCIT|nr:hypothetical protein CIRG_04826 [Coccidioides immitis RMSCC 2394]KMU77669.1 hypothetical protein CISG_01426 [Coccidioides immitis RMSCC 3703]